MERKLSDLFDPSKKGLTPRQLHIIKQEQLKQRDEGDRNQQQPKK